ncbi:MAG: AmmeMemoRadiSam system protein B [Candidatus Pacebacteria bacterium]|nr:AmmeMemoRadiSam system protein B [Candidatus Paceibacterota bacterium]
MSSRPFALVLLLVVVSFAAGSLFIKFKKNSPQVDSLIAAQFEEKPLFLSPIKQAKSEPARYLVTGITVPHHLLARDLIAKGFDYASANKYDSIVLLSPDHFNLGDSNISTTVSNFSTVFGVIQNNSVVTKFLKKLPFVHEQNFFYREHGLGAELPFVKYYFPESKIIILTFKEVTPKKELDQVVDELKKILPKNSLIVQSTDFSHYLTPENAEIYDRETIKVLNEAVPDKLWDLKQPSNMDSIASQYVQSKLQKEFFGSKLKIIDHKNSQDYTKQKITSSTSYIIQVYSKDF